MFSVVMCVHEDNPFLDEAIKSILNQTYSDFEFIIVANNCTDELYNKIRNYIDPRIRLFRTNIGQLSFNLNYAINIARGEFIIRMDSDDISLRNRLELSSGFIESDYDVIAFSCDYIDEYNNVIGGRHFVDDNASIRKIFLKNPIVHPATMIRKSVLLANRGYLGGFQSEDYDLWIRLDRNKCRFYFSSKKVLEYRIREGQSKGSLLPYCEVSGYFIREFLLTLKFTYLLGFIFSVFKRFTRI
ncbi:glycosyltransferase [Vibrio cholerae]|uniref:glycosyltransferase n=1 Tax=Vibrio cholerae TaxID=666 RepID=UPI003080D7D5